MKTVIRKVFLIAGICAVVTSYSNCSGFNSMQMTAALDSAFLGSSLNPSKACPAPKIGHSTLRKLNNLELTNSVNDLLGISSTIAVDLPPDAASSEGFTNNGDFLKTTSDYITLLMPAVESALASAQTAKSQIFTCPTVNKDDNCARSLIQSFVNKAFRKRLSSAELAEFYSFYNSQKSSGFEPALVTVYERILLSPNFLFRTAFDGNLIGGVAGLSGYEVVTRLAYFLWNSLPDDELLNVAETNQIFDETVLRNQIDRMLKDAKAKRFADLFISQWLGVDRILSSTLVSRDGLTDELRKDMVTEAKMYFSYILLQGKSVQDLVGGEYTFVNQRLAEHYGIAGVVGNDFRLVSLKGTLRRGLLTQAAFLTMMAKANETAPIGRGVKILQLITCTPPPPFDGGITVTQLQEASDPNMTIRERMEVHRASPKCAGCHQEMDPIGLGLERFDHLGRSRTTYANGRMIATEGNLNGMSFNNSSELLDIINQQQHYKRCISKNMMVYAIGRASTNDDKCMLQQIGNIAVQPDKTFTDLVMSLVMSPQFRYNSMTE